jgi:hypothetical protein
MSDVWEKGWDALNGVFRVLADELHAGNPVLWWSCGHADNESFPFWAWASFNRVGVAGEEDVVVSVSFRRTDRGLEFASDVATGDGEVLADGPRSQIVLATDTGTIRRWIEECFGRATAFVEEQTDLLRVQLC